MEICRLRDGFFREPRENIDANGLVTEACLKVSLRLAVFIRNNKVSRTNLAFLRDEGGTQVELFLNHITKKTEVLNKDDVA